MWAAADRGRHHQPTNPPTNVPNPIHPQAYDAALKDPAFQEEVAFFRKQYIGGPTPMYFAKRLTEKVGGAQIWLKR